MSRSYEWNVGTPLTDLPTLIFSKSSPVSKAVKPSASDLAEGMKLRNVSQSTVNSPATMNFVRNRMFYARPALNAKGRVTFGLRHIREFAMALVLPYPDE